MKSKLLPIALGLVSFAFIGCSQNEPRTTTTDTLKTDVKTACNVTKDSPGNA
jgi:hypothetical protein